MKQAEFLEKHNHSPWFLEEAAHEARKITDNEDLVSSAKAYLEAKEKLETELDKIGFEFG
jgi:hypothetical protein